MSWSGFHRLSLPERIERLRTHAGLSDQDVASLSGALAPGDADAFIENAVGNFSIPLGVAVGFVVDGQEVVVPMAVEESSVVAAASHGAKMAAAGGGFTTEVHNAITIGQVEVRDVPDPTAALRELEARRSDWMGRLDALIPRMVERGGGVRDIQAREVAGRVVLHVLVDCRDAMGANVVNTLSEALAPWAAEAFGGRPGLAILSNLATHRLASARISVPFEAVGGKAAAAAIVAANDWAVQDPYRAATHNKGIMNGIDPVLIATGNDWRAVEAGAHAYAARDGSYRALTHYALDGDRLHAGLELPLSVGTVGGVTSLHPTARACLRLLGSPDARRLAAIIASVGLAQNLAALRALATTGIQRGHMALHARNIARQAGLAGVEADRVARQMAKEGTVSVSRARELGGL